jgi:uncharacterized membrane protein YkvA (DUF1232 family)
MVPLSPPGNLVDTKAIESMISELCADAGAAPELRDVLAVVAERRGAEPGDEDLDQGVRFVIAYIEQVPYMMKVAWTAACNVGLEGEMRRILEMVNSYWQEGDDVIPDDLGVIGLLDDAYCSMTSLQAVSDHYRLQTGKHLFPDDLNEANRAMRQIIGEPYASELDLIVIRTMKETGLVETVTSLASEEKRLNLAANSTIWSHGPAGRLDITRLVPLGVTED